MSSETLPKEQEQIEKRLSEAFHLMYDGLPEPVQLCHKTYRVVAVNPAGAVFGRVPGQICAQGCPGLKAGLCRQAQMRKAGGYSALSVKVQSKGKTKVSGTMADGTKVSVSSLQLLLSGDAAKAYLPVAVPMYKGKLGGFGFLLELSSDGTAEVLAPSVWDASVSANGAFSATLEPVAAARLDAIASVEKTFELDVDAFPVAIASLPVIKDLLPNSVGITVSGGNRLTAADNSAKLKIAYKQATGLFTGSFNAYTLNGTKRKNVRVTLSGVFVDGKGYGSAVVKKSASSKITVK